MVVIYHDHDGVPGYRMLRDYLAMEGEVFSAYTIWKYAHELNLKSVVRKKHYIYVKGRQDHIYPNLINRNFNVNKPDKIWCTDFTYLKDPSTGARRYNCTIIDLFRREAVATLNGPEITAELAKATLALAVLSRKPEKGLILHSDQGRQFASAIFHNACLKYGIQQSMSVAGCPYDNAPMERFYNTLKHEFYYLYKFSNTRELDNGIYNFINVTYNHERPHTHNGGLPPLVA